MSDMDRFCELVLDGIGVDAGSRLSGSVRVGAPGDVRRLLVELVRLEESTGAAGVGEAVVDSRQLTGQRSFAGGEVLPFTIEVPADAGPTIVTPHARVSWTLQARADVLGPDLVDRVVLDVRPTREQLPSSSAMAHLMSGSSRHERSNRVSTTILSATFAGFGVIFATLTAVWAASPPEAWDGSLGPLWFTGALAVLMLLAGGLSWRSRQRRDLAGVEVSVSSPIRTGHTSVDVRVANDTGRTVHVGRLCVEVVLTIRNVGTARSVEHREHLLDDAWVEVAPGEQLVSLPFRAGLPPSVVGERVCLDHRVIVTPRRPKHPLAARDRHVQRFVVLP